MSHVYLCGPNSSTMFATCCGVAITGSQVFCPSCKEKVEEETHKERWQYAFGNARRRGNGE